MPRRSRRAAKAGLNSVRNLHAPSAWQLHVILKFSDEKRAIRFERYLKSGSGRALAKRHFEP